MRYNKAVAMTILHFLIVAVLCYSLIDGKIMPYFASCPK